MGQHPSVIETFQKETRPKDSGTTNHSTVAAKRATVSENVLPERRQMPLLRSESQGGGPGRLVKQHYEDTPSAPAYVRESLMTMTRFLDLLNSAIGEEKVWLLTSHDVLLLMADPLYDQGPWYVSISAFQNQYTVTYVMRKTEAPFPDAKVSGTTLSVEEAIRFTLLAMKLSDGWKDRR